MSSKPIHQWKVTELKEELKRRRLTTTGLKNDLVRRLDDALRAERDAAEASEKEVNGLEGHDNEAELKDSEIVSEDAVAVDERGNEEKFEAVEENVGSVEPIEREKAEKVLEGVVDDSSKYDNSASAMDQDVEPTVLPAVVDSSNVGEELITHTTVVETTTITTTVTESVLTEVVVDGEDSHSTEKKIEDSGTKLANEDLKAYSTDNNNGGSGTKLENEELKVNSAEKNTEVLGTKLENEESKAQLDNENSKPRLESDTKPSYKDLLPDSTVPKNQVSEVNPSLLGSQVKSDSIFSDSVSINQKNELKDTIITDNVKLEQDIVRSEMVEEPSPRNEPVYEESNSINVGKPHVRKLSVEENSNVVTSPDLNKTNISDDVGYPEKLSLDRSSGDDEDLPESSKVNVDELRDKVESTEVPTVKVENTTVVVGDGQSGGKSDTHQDIDSSPVGLVEKRKFNEQALDCNNDPAKRQRRWSTETVKGPNPQSTTPRSTTTPKDGPVSLKRNFSRSDSFATDDAPKKRIVPPSQRSPTNSLRIDRFLRPFTLKAVQELLGKTGKVSSFWMDQIKTHCYVTYSSTEEAIETRNAVYNLQWPPNGGRFLLAEYVEPEEVKMKLEPPPSQAPSISSGPAVPPAPPSQPEPSPRQHRELPPPPPTLPPPPPLSKPPPVGIERLPSPPPLPEKADLPTVTLDDLFRKTKATPRIYYLPLSEEQVAAKLAAKD
ncbi:PREDICTED: apoptotic chromatin condensation inducer in the nucleus-like isoform X2 [Lupinus angustifolius]|uniref:apoptotic chromatin condensation inducer in the nucleus-like isoform X2 n=1 Tax=Lupinus angustifolius TaxID=3871 RepID=UPI00092EFAF9|nr:PREDICTED: apoptotic chromatin condensation inducer in the nucleus-like isoform X2 [Lupinus angustifolius]